MAKGSGFISEAMAIPMLKEGEDLELARAWRDAGDEKALHRLVNSHIRLAISKANKFNKRYGVPVCDLVAEATVGLMKAAKKFDPERGVRFSTYATWWIRASFQEWVMRESSLVRSGSTASQKTLFFNYKRMRSIVVREARQKSEYIDGAEINLRIASKTGQPLRDVEVIEARLSGPDLSLNSLRSSVVNDEGSEWIEVLKDDSPLSSEIASYNIDQVRLKTIIDDTLSLLPEREQEIIRGRIYCDDKRTLESLGAEHGLSKERVRQLEVRALEKMREHIRGQLQDCDLEFA